MEGAAARGLFLGGAGRGGIRFEKEEPGMPDAFLTTTSQGWERARLMTEDGREGPRRTSRRRRGIDIDSLKKFLMPKV